MGVFYPKVSFANEGFAMCLCLYDQLANQLMSHIQFLKHVGARDGLGLTTEDMNLICLTETCY